MDEQNLTVVMACNTLQDMGWWQVNRLGYLFFHDTIQRKCFQSKFQDTSYSVALGHVIRNCFTETGVLQNGCSDLGYLDPLHRSLLLGAIERQPEER